MQWLRLESPAYWTAFVVMFFAVALWESARPARPWKITTGRRWTIHGAALVIGSVLGVLLLRLTPVAAAASVEQRSWGVLNQAFVPDWLRWVAGFAILDFSRYLTHRLFHSVPLFWRFHRVHHSDPDYDFTTSFRFHPIEPLLQRAASLVPILLLAPPAGAVLAAELCSCFANFFDHANANLPLGLDRAMRFVFVTPRIHRLHHCTDAAMQGKNLGEVLPLWDRLFGTYHDPAETEDFEVGMSGYAPEECMSLTGMLAEPFHAERPDPANALEQLN